MNISCRTGRSIYPRWKAPLLACAFLAATAIAVAQPVAPTPAASESAGVPGKGTVGSWPGTLNIGAMGLRIAPEVLEIVSKCITEGKK